MFYFVVVNGNHCQQVHRCNQFDFSHPLFSCRRFFFMLLATYFSRQRDGRINSATYNIHGWVQITFHVNNGGNQVHRIVIHQPTLMWPHLRTSVHGIRMLFSRGKIRPSSLSADPELITCAFRHSCTTVHSCGSRMRLFTWHHFLEKKLAHPFLPRI